MPPSLPLGLSRQAVLKRPRLWIDPILADARPAATEQRVQSAAVLVIGSFYKCPFTRGSSARSVLLNPQSRHVFRYVLGVFWSGLEPRFQVAPDHALELSSR